uniref:CHK kinase-like domain-containing protein n=2 Tax=Clastoptera arizonana TaxID=38151 RepID=A0A1B6EBX7_9HEMI
MQSMDSITDIPFWLDKNFLTQLLLVHHNSDQIDVATFEVTPAVSNGNNYSSIVLRVFIKYEENGKLTQKSLIIKTELPNGKTKDVIEEIGIFNKERFLYREVIPIMKDIIGFNLVPEYYPSSEAIVLEDLKEKGYVLCDRLNRLDFDHCNIFMKIIGKFHAASFYIQESQPELFKNENITTKIDFTSNPHPEVKDYFYNSFKCFQSALEEWHGFEQTAIFIENNLDKLWNKMVEVHSKKKHIALLNHGDAWSANMLFKHDENGKVVDVKLIDLQIYKIVSPALDLITFLLTSTQEEVRKHRLSELYDSYLHSFNSLLKNVGCDFQFTSETLHDELEYLSCVYFCFLPWHVSLSQCDIELNIDDNIATFKRLNDEGKKLTSKIFNGVHFKAVATYTIKMLENEAFFQNFSSSHI